MLLGVSLATAAIGAEATSKLVSPKLKAVMTVFRVGSLKLNEYFSLSRSADFAGG